VNRTSGGAPCKRNTATCTGRCGRAAEKRQGAQRSGVGAGSEPGENVTRIDGGIARAGLNPAGGPGATIQPGANGEKAKGKAAASALSGRVQFTPWEKPSRIRSALLSTGNSEVTMNARPPFPRGRRMERTLRAITPSDHSSSTHALRSFPILWWLGDVILWELDPSASRGHAHSNSV
jgi:hypothetical protein